MKLDVLIRTLGVLAPLELAADWDNVGLLVRPHRPRSIERVLLTIDLTSAVYEEARRQKAELIVAYHPPIFAGLKRVGDARSTLVARALEDRVAIYSPHTALDAVDGGVNDWLADAVGPGVRLALEPTFATAADETHKLVVFVPEEAVDKVRSALAATGAAGVIGNYTECSFGLSGTGTFRGNEASSPVVGERGRFERAPEVRMEMVCRGGADLVAIEGALRKAHPYETPAWELIPLAPKPQPGRGQGRRVELKQPTPLPKLVRRIKRHLGVSHVRVATSAAHANGASVASVALCPGAGGSVLAGVGADLYLTGEMRHHDVLAACERGTSVLLTEHTNCERGYLPRFAERLTQATSGAVSVHVARADIDPLVVH